MYRETLGLGGGVLLVLKFSHEAKILSLDRCLGGDVALLGVLPGPRGNDEVVILCHRGVHPVDGDSYTR